MPPGWAGWRSGSCCRAREGSACARQVGRFSGRCMTDRILIVEDEQKLAKLLGDYLAQEGFEVALLHRGDEVEGWMRANRADLVLLDLMLPGKSGLEVCKSIRA